MSKGARITIQIAVAVVSALLIGPTIISKIDPYLISWFPMECKPKEPCGYLPLSVFLGDLSVYILIFSLVFILSGIVIKRIWPKKK